MAESGKVTKSKHVSLETKAKAICTVVFPISVCRCKSRTGKKADRERWIPIKDAIGREL